MNSVPQLPETAPFTPEQRAYLNGFLAGLFSRSSAPDGALPKSEAPKQSLIPLTILFGSQTGNAENLAKRMAKEAGKRGFAPTVYEMSRYPVAQLESEERLLIVTSTFGDGEPPDNAKPFWDVINGENAPKLAQTRFSLCGLGDSNYSKFCGFGKDLESRLKSLGARAVHARADCDVEYQETFAKWLSDALSSLTLTTEGASVSAIAETTRTAPATVSSESTEPSAEAQREPATYSRSNPFAAVLQTNRTLNLPGSAKETRHFEIALTNSGLRYEAGDALGVVPANCPELVEELLEVLQFSGGEAVPGREAAVPVREALLRHYEITRIPQPLLRVMAERTGDELLKRLAAPGANGELTQFLWGREIIDLLMAHPQVKFSPIEFVGLLKKIAPRLYSISSSPRAHPDAVHLTVNVLRYDSLGRRRKGICSTFLADRAAAGIPVPVFVHTNKHFRPPPSGDTPIVMVGPGTGIAPFRAFLQERRESGAKGRNWLFFGDQRSATDFLYRDELEAMQRAGVLTRLDTAFSRDQSDKIYVQHRMRDNAKDLFAWLEDGAHFYVCGDASRMAKDVDLALHEIIQAQKGCTAEQAKEYVARLRSDKRYQRDVY